MIVFINIIFNATIRDREILNPSPRSELAQLSFPNLSCRIVSKISQVHCDFLLYFIVLMF